MSFPRFWADDFDMDLPRVLPDLDDILGHAASIPLWTHAHTSYGRLNHPSVWGSPDGGMDAYFGLTPDETGKPDSYVTGSELVECTFREALRDAWPHTYTIVVAQQDIWDAGKWRPWFEDLMYDLRGIRPLPSGQAEQIKALLHTDLIGAVERLRLLVDMRAAGEPR